MSNASSSRACSSAAQHVPQRQLRAQTPELASMQSLSYRVSYLKDPAGAISFAPPLRDNLSSSVFLMLGHHRIATSHHRHHEQYMSVTACKVVPSCDDPTILKTPCKRALDSPIQSLPPFHIQLAPAERTTAKRIRTTTLVYILHPHSFQQLSSFDSYLVH